MVDQNDGPAVESPPPTLSDLLRICGELDYSHAVGKVDWVIVEGVKIPFASPELLWDLKQTKRGKDSLDVEFLKERLRKKRH